MPKCPECGYKFEVEEATEEEIHGRVIERERKIIAKKVPEGEAIGCLYCGDCEKFGWGENKCRWCGGTNIYLYSQRCSVEDYKRGINIT